MLYTVKCKIIWSECHCNVVVVVFVCYYFNSISAFFLKIQPDYTSKFKAAIDVLIGGIFYYVVKYVYACWN